MSEWIVRPRPRPAARVRLLCLPYAGAGVTPYRPWADLLPATVELAAVHLPGRETRHREPLYTRLTPLLGALITEIQPLLDLPLALFGHSFGGLVAFELARRIGPCHLFISGRRAPTVPPAASLHTLGEREFVEAIRRLGGTPEAILEDPEMRGLLLPSVRADLSAAETHVHVPGPLLECPMTVIGGANDSTALPEHLEPWKAQTSGTFASHTLPGGHFYLHREREHLLRIIGEALR